MSGLGALFYRTVISKSVSALAVSAFIVFYMWRVVEAYRSVFLSGLIVTIYLAIELGFAVPMGHLIDRHNNTVLNLVASALVPAGFSLLLVSQGLPFIYAATAVSVFGQTLKNDSFFAIIKRHLPEGSFKEANSVNTALSSASSLLGTLLGGAAIELFPGGFAPIIVAVSLASTLMLRPEAEVMARAEGSSLLEEFRAVGGFLRRISGVLVLALFVNGLMVSLETYASGLFSLVLRASPLYYTAFVMAVPLGTIAGTPVAGTGYFRKDRPLAVAAMLVLFAPLIVLLSLSRSPLLDIADAFAIGVVIPVINIPINTKIMKATPGDVFGKVNATIRVFTAGTTPAMGALFSSLAALFPVTSVLFWVGIAVIPVTAYGFLAIPQLFRM